MSETCLVDWGKRFVRCSYDESKNIGVCQVDKWDKLYERVVTLDRDRRERERLERERADAIRVFDAWCAQATEAVMLDLHAQLSQRAVEFEQRARASVEILYPARAPIATPPEGPFMTFLHLHVAYSQVHLYSHRLSGAWPLLHMILVASDPRTGPPSMRNRTLVSSPGCMIVQRADGARELRRVCPTDPQHDGEVMTVEEVVFRCFELLVDGLRRAT
jgi:hypothetical protein